MRNTRKQPAPVEKKTVVLRNMHTTIGATTYRGTIYLPSASSSMKVFGGISLSDTNRSPGVTVSPACLCRKSNLLTLRTFALQRAEELSDEGVFLRASALLANGWSV